MPNSTNCCLSCGCKTIPGHFICSDECFKKYADDNRDLYDADAMADLYPDNFDDDESLEDGYGGWDMEDAYGGGFDDECDW